VRRPHPLTLAAGAALAAAITALVLALNPPAQYIVLPHTASPLDPAVRVEGTGKPPATNGEIYWVDVLERRATWFDRAFPPDGSEFADIPPGTNEEEQQQQNEAMMEQSERAAEYVALRAAGYDATARPLVTVAGVTKGKPADGRLEAGDEIVAVDGVKVHEPIGLRRVIRAREVGASHVFVVKRGVPPQTVRVQVATVADEDGHPVVGIEVETELRVRIPEPLDVDIDLGRVGGPSAGLAFALQLTQELGRDVTRGYNVAATGTLGLDGTVGAIGGIKQKTFGARDANIDVFLVPVDGDNAKEARRYAGGMRIIAVTTFQQALRALATLPRKG
jgi:PDZ domain-containing protein